MNSIRAPYTTTHHLWDRMSAMFYSSHVTPFHSHNTMQLIFDLGKQFRFRTPDTHWIASKGLLIRENTIHRLDTCGSVQLIIYLDAASEIAEAIRRHYLGSTEQFVPVDDLRQLVRPDELQRCLISPYGGSLEKVVENILRRMRVGPVSAKQDHRVKQIVSLLAGSKAEEMTIRRLAELVCLSESRLRSLFRENTGISLHRYIILSRIDLAVSKIMNGATISAAAVGSGFSDSSHFHRVFLQLFGTSPSQFIRYNSSRRVERSGASPLKLVTNRYDERSWDIEKVLVI